MQATAIALRIQKAMAPVHFPYLALFSKNHLTVRSKIIQAFVTENSYLIEFYEINICQVTIFRRFAVNKKHDDGKHANQTSKKLQVQ